MQINMNVEKWQGVHTNIKNEIINEEETLRVIKANKINEYDENTYAKLIDICFHNGIIEVKMLSRLLLDALDFARGFIGIAFRISETDSEFESFYIRPTNGRQCNDPVRKAHGCQYFSYPYYTFEYFRNHQINDYEAPIDVDLNEWVTLKAIIIDNHAEFFINNNTQPVLIVDDMKHGSHAKGSIGLFVDIGTEAFFKDLKVECYD